jgi:hypothetical protein
MGQFNPFSEPLERLPESLGGIRVKCRINKCTVVGIRVLMRDQREQ